MMRPFALQITTDDFGFAAGHRRHRPFEAHRHQFYSASRQAKPRPMRDNIIAGRAPVLCRPRSIQLGTAVAPSLAQRLQRMRRPKEGTGASSGQPSIGPHARGRSAGNTDTDAVPAHAGERRGMDWLVIPGHTTKEHTGNEIK
jgi:hypothetical protein